MKKFSCLGLLLAVFLAGCSSDPYAIKPNPVPHVKATLKVERLWHRDAGKGLGGAVGIRLHPAVTRDRVFVANASGRIVALSRKKGKAQWAALTGLPVSGGVSAGYGQVLFGTLNGLAVALSAVDGQVLWRQQLSSEILSVPVSNGNRVVFLTEDGQITALDATTGKPVWNYSVTVPGLILRGGATPLIDQDVVYVGLASGKVVALNMSDGTPVWSQQVAIPKGTSDLDRMVDIDNNLIIDQGGLFAATYQGTVAVMSATQGQLFWGRDISTYTPMSNYSNALFIASADGDVTAVNEQDGTFTWTQKALHGRHLIGTVIQAGHVVTGDDEGWLYWLDPANGHLLARYHATGGFAGMPCVFDDTLYAQGVKGDVLALRVVSKPE